MRRLPYVFALLAVGLILTGGVIWLIDDPSTRARPLTLEPTTFDLDLPPGEHELVVRITNPSTIPKRIIGLGEA